jgi:hypothetical protein
MSDPKAAAVPLTPVALLIKSDPALRLTPASPRPKHGRYTAAWSVVGLFAAGYAASVLVVPDIRSASTADATAAATATALDKTMADVAQLKRQVGAIEGQVAAVRQQTNQQDAREKALSERVGTIENRIEAFTTQITQITADAGKKAGSAVAAASAPPVAPTRIVNGEPRQPSARIETGSITPPAAPTPAAPREAARPPAVAGWGAVATPTGVAATTAPSSAPTVVPADVAGVQLATSQSVDALRLSWNLLNDRHGNVLRTLEPRVIEAGPGRYTLVAGPLPSDAEAGRICQTLRSRGVACQPAEFRGSGL